METKRYRDGVKLRKRERDISYFLVQLQLIGFNDQIKRDFRLEWNGVQQYERGTAY